MRRIVRTLAFLLSAGGLPIAAAAQMPAPTCATVVAPGGQLGAWTTPVARVAADHPAQLTAAVLPIGQAVHLALRSQDQVEFALPPARPGGAADHAGLLTLTIARPGTYRIALGTGAWIDLVDQGKFVASTAHTHGPACSGIRKIVDFALHAGSYTVQVSANAEPGTTVLAVRTP